MGVIAKEGFRSAVFIFTGFLVGIVTNMFVFPALFTKEQLGEYKIYLNWGLVLAQFLSLGSGAIAVRHLGRLKSKGLDQYILFLVILLPFIGLLVFALFSIFAGPWFISQISNHLSLPVVQSVIVIFLFAATQSYIKAFSGLSIAMGQISSNFLFNEVYVRIMVLIAFLGFYFNIVSFFGMFLLIALCFFMQLIFIIYHQGNLKRQKLLRPDKASFFEMMYYGSYALLDSGATILVTRLDIIMISAIMANSDREAQLYDMALSMATILILPWRSLNTASTPVISEALEKQDFKMIDKVYKKTSLNSLLAGGFLWVLLVAGMDEIFSLIPDNYNEAKYAMVVMATCKLVDMTSSVNNVILILSPYFKWNLYFNLFLIVLTIISNLILIPRLGITGSAIATLISIFLFNVMKGTFIYMKYKLLPFHRNTFKALMLLSGCFFIGYFFPPLTPIPFINLVIKSGVVTCIFIPVLLYTEISIDMNQMALRLVKKYFPFLVKKYNAGK